MKVLFIITKGNNIGGAQIYVRDLACKMAENGNDVFVAMGSRGQLGLELEQAGIKTIYLKHLVVPINIIEDIRCIFEISTLISSIKPDIVSLNSSKVGIVGRFSCWLKRKPNVFVVHGWSFTPGIGKLKAKLFKLIEKILKPFSSYWICVSEFDYQYGIKHGVLKKDKTKRIYNGVKVIESFNRKSTSDDNTLKAVMIARHDYQKDHRTLFKALQLVNNVIVTLIGDGPLQEKNKNLARDMGVGAKLNFVGYQEDVSKFLKDSNLFLLISNWEGFPISTLEAMSYKLPVIISNVGGAAEAITDGLDGYIIEHKDFKKLASVLQGLQNMPKKLHEMGTNAHGKCLENFSFDRTYSETMEFFNEIVLK